MSGRIPIHKKILKIIFRKYACKFGGVKIIFVKESQWSTWVYRISLNVCLTLLKKKKSKGHHYHFVSDSLTAEETEDNYRVFRRISEFTYMMLLDNYQKLIEQLLCFI